MAGQHSLLLQLSLSSEIMGELIMAEALGPFCLLCNEPQPRHQTSVVKTDPHPWQPAQGVTEFPAPLAVTNVSPSAAEMGRRPHLSHASTPAALFCRQEAGLTTGDPLGCGSGCACTYMPANEVCHDKTNLY